MVLKYESEYSSKILRGTLKDMLEHLLGYCVEHIGGDISRMRAKEEKKEEVPSGAGSSLVELRRR